MAQQSRLNEALSNLDAKLERLCSRENEARSILQFIIEERRALEAERLHLQKQHSPFNLLPTELLLEIFCSYVHFVGDAMISTDSKTLATFCRRPIVLTQVCQRWREVALSASMLWTRIYLDNPDNAAVFFRRSGSLPLEIFGINIPALSQTSLAMFSSLVLGSLPRWRSLNWGLSSSQILQELVISLNSSAPLLHLRVLRLTQEHQFCFIPDEDSLKPSIISCLAVSAPAIFPVLECLYLGNIAISDLPPSMFPSLHTLELHYPTKNSTGAHHMFYMSELCALLSRAPNLSDISLNVAVPLVDVHVHESPTIPDAHSTSSPYHSRRSPHVVKTLVLPRLHRLDWNLAPPKDAWLLFKFIDPRSLRLLEICLNRSGVRWPQLDLDMAPGDMPVVQFSQLEELRLECVDTEGLSTSLKKMNFPALRKLNISFLPPAAVGPKSTHLPRHESIFREPRLPNLTHLSLSRFSLDKDNMKMMLRYLQALTHLTLDSCPGAGPVVCSLSGGACANSHVSSTRTWTCPRLQHLRLVCCPDVRFRCLSGMVHSRKVCSSDDAGGSVVLLGKGRQFDVATSRVVKPLKKTAMSHSGSAPSTPYGKGHNSVMSAAGTSASPNGSLLSEWNPYAILKPSCLVTIYIASCPRISEAEAMSLKSTNWGVSDVTYYQ